MATSTTTLAAIRDALVTGVKALTPSVATATTHSSKGFEFASRVQFSDFRDWAEDNVQACHRKYAMQWGVFEPASAWDGDIQRRGTELEFVMAYPQQFGRYGADNLFDLHDAVEGDMSQVLSIIGTKSSTYPAGSVPVDESVELEEGDGVTFGIARVQIEYFYQTP